MIHMEADEIWLPDILLYNKYGLSLDDFEREYRVTEGKPVPFKLLGYDSCNDLLNNIPEYVKVLQVEGHTLLLGVANEVTRHVQKLVGKAVLESFVSENANDMTTLTKKLRKERRLRKINAAHSVANHR